MILLLAVAAILAIVAWEGARRTGRHANWRGASGITAILALAAGGLLVVRGDWPMGLGLCVLAAALAFGSRWPGRLAPQPRHGMSLEEARAILGVGPEATQGEIRQAYTRLMRRAHPDQGGTSGLAAQVNAARDRLRRH